MSCDTVIERLEAHIAGGLGDAERRAVDAHLRSCAGCRELRALLGGAVIEPPGDLVTAVLNRTSGSTCGSARARLCDHVDGGLGEVDAALLRSHLDGCADCGSLSRVLALLAVELPRLAELPLDDGFVADVLARTSAGRRPQARWADRIADVWQGLVRRPRLAWEGAYVATMILLLIFGRPGSPLIAVPAKVVELARVNPVQELKDPAARLTAELEQAWQALGVDSAWHSSGQWFASKSREGASSVAELSESTLDGLKELGTLWPVRASESAHDENDDE